jgi:hypothetical protein
MSEAIDSSDERVAFSMRLSADGKHAHIQLGDCALLVSAEEAFRMAITLQHIAALAKGNGG